MTIANRLLFGFMVGVLLMVSIGVYALGQIRAVRDELSQIVSQDFDVYHQLDHIRATEGALAQSRLQILARYWSHAYAGNAAGLESAVAQWNEHARTTEQGLRQAQSNAANTEDVTTADQRRAMFRNIAGTLGQTFDSFEQTALLSRQMFAAMTAGRDDVVRERAEELDHAEIRTDALISEVTASLAEAVQAGRLNAARMYDFSSHSLFVGLIVAVLVALAVTFWTRRSIIAPLALIMQVMERAGQGDLSQRVTLGRSSVTIRDEVSRLSEGLNRMIEGLSEIARQSRGVTRDLDAAIAEIRASAQQQAASVEEQFAAVQETAATVDEITHSGAQVSRRARELIDAAQISVNMSVQGLEAVAESARVMSGIHSGGEAVAKNIVDLSERTEAIGEIITTVNDLSERSHLLALNAAIEAAAAGENGRSFAVVAAEMKILADQSRAATRNVRVILGDIQRGINTSVMLTEESVKRVAQGRTQTDLATHTIERLASGIEDSVHAFQQIVASTNQQQIGIEQVMAALQSIREASQQTATGTRNLDGSASNLGSLSRQLLALSDRYRT
ncbi:methyl-accepting chemotaxis sensory transducer [Ameyamaea chiangmaiensis NBRC 103196]|uniref:Methyl-accepting chemotaxis protein n=1 Tax=Ameyamaea chiangmaiensis TaxID=442969 RepID=A0A850PFV9_9PROT|nr:methyl-accepting chemotaxis protein [Ameyamaea chiangmaiensis]MBS4074464.1 methyl-accepting chemotaxis protein [Ameyamaea chiangmaiensis]NVN41723.1 methyl-accepting chemotaxis protein [Ameyamaea chiangmaiensis]GBQ72132.1 methyl-accepting chemotaxis sensory transducer [Ameyamaea chiangmaiensis NBRC 103196]